MAWLGVLGLSCGLAGAVVLAYGLVVRKERAIQLATPRYAESVDATMPAVADRLRQSRHTITGLALLFVGFLLQLLAAWSKPTASFVLVATPGSAVHPAAVWLSGVGLILGLAAAVVLLRSLFITDEEIARLSELPLGESGTHLTLKDDRAPRPVALVIADAAEEYTASFIASRRGERTRGRQALALLVAAFAFQLAGLVLGVALPN